MVQRHRARRRHYDLRLEADGVLLSWAVPRGPSLDPDTPRLAVHVGDHPLEYFDFEGVIPAGQYGAGDVIVWDWGTWHPEAETPDPRAAVEAGELKLVLEGERLRGRFVLVRTSGRPPATGAAGDPGTGAQDTWLLLHKRDDHAVAGWDAEAHPSSVRCGLTNDEVRDAPPAVWVGDAPPDRARIDLSAASPAGPAGYVAPMAAALATDVPTGPEWLFEVKWDGFRVQAVVADGTTRLFTRNGVDADAYFPGVLDPPTWIRATDAVVDGEMVALDSTGRPDFNLLQDRLGPPSAQPGSAVVYQAFDLLRVDGRSLLDVPLEDRKRLLELLLRPHPHVRYADHVTADGPAFLAALRSHGLEGLVAKRRNSRYEPGRRSGAWQKVKIRPGQDLVVGGWTPSRSSPHELGALVVGVHEGGRLRFAGKVGSGFTQRARATLQAELAGLATDGPPFDPVPPISARGRWGAGLADVRWVRPELVIRAELGGWSSDGLVRQASYKGIDRGRDPGAVEREVAGRLTQQSGPGGLPATGTTGVGLDSAGAAPHADPAAASDDLLIALARVPAAGGTLPIDGHPLRLTNLDKVLFEPRAGEPAITKRELIGYFLRVGPAMLPHLADRPLNLHRFPDGAHAPGFWQKALPDSAPAWLTRWREPMGGSRGPNTHVVGGSLATLAWLGNQAAFEVHPWTSTCTDPNHPTFALVDIDPGATTTWEQTLTLARLFRTALEHLALLGFAKTTGSRGLQIWIPIERGRYTFEQTTAWVETLSRAVGATVPDLVSWEWAKSSRGGRARLDFTQNAANRTLVAPYAVRPAAGAPVSMPIRWEELDDPDLRSDRWTIRTAADRVAEVGDLFADAQRTDQQLPRL